MFFDDAWIDAAKLTTQHPQKGWQVPLELTYESTYIANHFGSTDQKALCSNYPVDFFVPTEKTWPSFLLDILPQGYGKRRLLRDFPNETDASDDWYSLAIGAHNPIGNMRIKEANDHFLDRIQGMPSDFNAGFSLEEIIEKSPKFLDYLDMHHYGVAGSSGLQGECPKYLLTRDLNGRFHIDGLIADDQIHSSYILKQPKTKNNERDHLILTQESNYLDLAKDIGLKVGSRILNHHDQVLIPRFDRFFDQKRLIRLAQESLLTLMNRPGYGISFHHQDAVLAMDNHCTNPCEDIAEYLARDMLNMAWGNKDNHGRNTAFHRFNGVTQISPLFDFAPMYLDQDVITRSAVWRHFEKNGAVDYVSAVEWMLDDVSKIKENPNAFFSKLLPILNNMDAMLEIASFYQIDEKIIQSRRPHVESIINSASQIKEKFKSMGVGHEQKLGS